ncbi:hypothetical protein TRV_04575 [Trichophyton verrucosum HKI 0517]|uniref:Uncharacterized protein n=1 Tax=Trichophyton verrucosum (strain HKI 0517) TaxID=663202 RepID=D4DBS4_TRIVH|nr:uncharacterized protein TRV_04575 [Trichophyton verrucosum HKI 0517]EFE40695.1 hypothetical protein TRV_04575 [Trichophyton verrucosum HKI 0517]
MITRNSGSYQVESERLQGEDVGRPQELGVGQGLLGRPGETAEKGGPGLAQQPQTGLLVGRGHRRRVDGEEQGLGAAGDAGQVRGRVEHHPLHRLRVEELDYRVDVVQVDLPQLEELRRRRVKPMEVEVAGVAKQAQGLALLLLEVELRLLVCVQNLRILQLFPLDSSHISMLHFYA